MIRRPKEIQKFLNISESTYHRLRREGKLPHPIQISARIYGYRSEDIEAWLSARVVGLSDHGDKS